jgi:rhs-related protein (fragment)
LINKKIPPLVRASRSCQSVIKFIVLFLKNKERIEKGLSPQIEIEIEHKATGKTMVVSVSMELEHTYLKQRGKSFKAHGFWNLTEATPWGHASMDKYRHISKKYKIIKVIKGMSTF